MEQKSTLVELAENAFAAYLAVALVALITGAVYYLFVGLIKLGKWVANKL